MIFSLIKRGIHKTGGTEKSPFTPYTLRFFIFLLLITSLRLIYISKINMSPDEVYYWGWSHNLQLSYYDHPPFVAYAIYLTGFLGWNSEFFVRLSAVLFGTGMGILLFYLSKDLFGDEKTGFYSALLANATLLFPLGSIIITPDTPLCFFWLLSLFFLYKAFNSNYAGWWYLSGITLGLALLSKYTAFLFFPCLFLYFVFSSKNKKLLKTKEPYIMVALALLVFSPVIIWNYQHDFVSFGFQLKHGFKSKENFSALKSLNNFLGSQIALVTPIVFFLFGYSFYKIIKVYTLKKDNYLFLLSFSLPLFLFFLALSFRSKMEGNWPAFSYLTALIAVSAFYVEEGERSRFLRKFYLTGLVSGLILVTLIHGLAVFPPRFILRKTNLAERLYGWPELGGRVKEILGDDGRSFVLGTRHQILSEISFYTDRKYPIFQAQARQRYGDPGDISSLLGQDALYVEEKNRDQAEGIKKYFVRMEKLEPLEIIIKGQLVRTFMFYRLYDYQGGLI